MIDLLLEMGFHLDRINRREDCVYVLVGSPGTFHAPVPGQPSPVYDGLRMTGQGSTLAEAVTLGLARLVQSLEQTVVLNERENEELNRELAEARRSLGDLAEAVRASEVRVEGVVRYVNDVAVSYDPNATLPGMAQDGGPGLETLTFAGLPDLPGCRLTVQVEKAEAA